MTAKQATGPIELGQPGSIGCPSNTELATHLAGQTSEVGSPVANHLMVCPRCQMMANVVHTAVRAFTKK